MVEERVNKRMSANKRMQTKKVDFKLLNCYIMKVWTKLELSQPTAFVSFKRLQQQNRKKNVFQVVLLFIDCIETTRHDLDTLEESGNKSFHFWLQ